MNRWIAVRRAALLAALALAGGVAIFVLLSGIRLDMPRFGFAPAPNDAARVIEARRFLDEGNSVAALREFRSLAEQGNAQAQYWLGHMYELGLGTARDGALAVEWIGKAAAQGLVPAQLRLGQMYRDGRDTLQDFAQAHDWLERAAKAQNAVAQRELGELFANGWGVPRDPATAYAWYQFAAMRGDREAVRRRDALLLTMTTAEIAAAQERARTMAAELFGQRPPLTPAPAPSSSAPAPPPASATPAAAPEAATAQ